jgi:ribosomal protein S18 acetylase RimI-like enzyme
MALRLERYDDVDTFEGDVLPFLLQREAEHNLFIGICGQIRAGRYTDFYLSAVSADGGIRGAAFRTPPFPLTLSCIDDPAAIELIAFDAHELYGSLPGAGGPKDDVREFARAWQRVSGQRGEISMQQRIYQATTSTAPTGVPGEMRDATANERDLLVSWFEAFNVEAGVLVSDAAANVDLRLAARPSGLAVWWDGDPVSMVGFGAPTPNGVRVGPVYTPPELRGRGYASACTAAVTQRLFDAGRRFVFLYTDLANPTSNSIYRKIGYRPVMDVDQYRFA